MTVQPQWWGYSKEHGWVVLDREMECNGPGMRSELLFLRCRDAKAFLLKRELWRLPAYQFAPNYVRSLAGEAADEAAADVESLMNRWPELRGALRSQYDQMRAEQRVTERSGEAKDAQESESAAEPRRAAGRSLKSVSAESEN